MALLPPDPVFCLKSVEMGSVTSLSFHNTERLLAGTQKGTVYLWDLQTNRTTYNLKVGDKPMLNILHTDSALITQEKEGTLKIWNLTNSGYVLGSTEQNEHLGFCRFVHDASSNTIISPKSDTSICIFNAEDLAVQQALVVPENLPYPLGHVMCLCSIQLSSQQFILAGFESGVLMLWDPRSSKVVNSLMIGEAGECVMTVDYDHVTNRGLCGGSTDKIQVFGIDRKSHEIFKKSEICIKNAGINCIKIRKDLKVFASGGWDGRVRIFSWKSLRPLAVLTEHRGALMDIAYSNDAISHWKSPIMAAGGGDGQISLWDLYN